MRLRLRWGGPSLFAQALCPASAVASAGHLSYLDVPVVLPGALAHGWFSASVELRWSAAREPLLEMVLGVQIDKSLTKKEPQRPPASASVVSRCRRRIATGRAIHPREVDLQEVRRPQPLCPFLALARAIACSGIGGGPLSGAHASCCLFVKQPFAKRQDVFLRRHFRHPVAANPRSSRAPAPGEFARVHEQPRSQGLKPAASEAGKRKR
jgi:hypothetical protein